MGAWSTEPFGNDEAGDWAYELVGTEDLSLIEAALDAVLDADDYLESREGSNVVAAIEVLAKLRGKGTQSDAYTEKVDDWVKKVSIQPSAALLGKAKRALQRVRAEDSELKELWEEPDATAWRASLDSLEAAMSD